MNEMKPITNINGITIKQLKDLVKDLPETDGCGEDYTVWLMSDVSPTLSSQCVSIWRLNEGDLCFDIRD